MCEQIPLPRERQQAHTCLPGFLGAASASRWPNDPLVHVLALLSDHQVAPAYTARRHFDAIPPLLIRSKQLAPACVAVHCAAPRIVSRSFAFHMRAHALALTTMSAVVVDRSGDGRFVWFVLHDRTCVVVIAAAVLVVLAAVESARRRSRGRMVRVCTCTLARYSICLRVCRGSRSLAPQRAHHTHISRALTLHNASQSSVVLYDAGSLVCVLSVGMRATSRHSVIAMAVQIGQLSCSLAHVSCRQSVLNRSHTSIQSSERERERKRVCACARERARRPGSEQRTA